MVVLLPIILFAQKNTTPQKTSVAFFPVLSYSPQTKLQFGALAIFVLGGNAPDSSAIWRQSTISPLFIYTMENQIVSAVRWTYFTPKQNLLEGSVRFLDFPNSYFGIGNDNDPKVSENYGNRLFRIQGSYFKAKNSTTFIGLSGNIQYNIIGNLVENGLLQTDNAIGINGGFLCELGPGFRLDTRNSNIYPDRGYFLSFQSLFSFIGDFDFTNLVLDGRKFVSLWNKENILAFQFSSSFILGNNVPFYRLPRLGGSGGLRGISNSNLYLDRQMIYGQIEYRRPLFWRLGMVAFAGLGDVADRFSDFSLNNIKYAFGLGGRILVVKDRKLNLSLDLGMANGNQFAFYIGIGEAF